MYIDTEGIILRQTKTVNGRRMLLIFSKRYGKISAGTSISEKGKGKTTLAMRPFTLGKYQLYKNRDNYNINGAETVKSFYKIGEDVEKYMVASYILEWTEKVLPEGMENSKLFNLLDDFLTVIEKRGGDYETLAIAYQVKALRILGQMPMLGTCANCGATCGGNVFNITAGGTICENCKKELQEEADQKLIYVLKFDIVGVLNYFDNNSLFALEKIGLNKEIMVPLKGLLKEYAAYYLDIGELKSEGFLKGMF